jgi:hypothetical protein
MLTTETKEPIDHPDFASFKTEEMENWFQYHAPTPEQLVAYGAIRRAARQFADVLNHFAPASADKTAAMRKIREATMACNMAVACN